jgi:ethanolamine utilization protein EutN
MKLAVVIGQVVSTIKSSGFEQDRLLIVDIIGADGKQTGDTHVASDNIGAGNDEWVLVVSGSSARKAVSSDAPVDMSIIGIVDEVVIHDKLIFHK